MEMFNTISYSFSKGFWVEVAKNYEVSQSLYNTIHITHNTLSSWNFPTAYCAFSSLPTYLNFSDGKIFSCVGQ